MFPLFGVVSSKQSHELHMQPLVIKVNNLKADNPLYLTQNVFYLTNREALTVPCSVVKHARTKRFEHEKDVLGETRDVVQ